MINLHGKYVKRDRRFFGVNELETKYQTGIKHKIFIDKPMNT
jgi:hypothetical protein